MNYSSLALAGGSKWKDQSHSQDDNNHVHHPDLPDRRSFGQCLDTVCHREGGRRCLEVRRQAARTSISRNRCMGPRSSFGRLPSSSTLTMGIEAVEVSRAAALAAATHDPYDRRLADIRTSGAARLPGYVVVAALHLSPRGRMGAVQDELPGQRLRRLDAVHAEYLLRIRAGCFRRCSITRLHGRSGKQRLALAAGSSDHRWVHEVGWPRRMPLVS